MQRVQAFEEAQRWPTRLSSKEIHWYILQVFFQSQDSKSAGMGRHGVLVQPPTGGGPLGTLVQNGARLHHLVSYHANDVVSGSTLWCCKEHHLISSTRLRPGGAEAVVDQLDALPTGDFVVANRTHLADAFCSKQSNFIRQAQHPSLQPGGVVDKL